MCTSMSDISMVVNAGITLFTDLTSKKKQCFQNECGVREDNIYFKILTLCFLGTQLQ